jgi:hypothetical protein
LTRMSRKLRHSRERPQSDKGQFFYPQSVAAVVVRTRFWQALCTIACCGRRTDLSKHAQNDLSTQKPSRTPECPRRPKRRCGGTFCCDFVVRGLSLALLFGITSADVCQVQCSAVASTLRYASDCAVRATPEKKIASLDAAHPCSLAELIDIAEHNNPTTRIVWERAKQRAESLGIAKSEYFPVLVVHQTQSDPRFSPFPTIPTRPRSSRSLGGSPFRQPEQNPTFQSVPPGNTERADAPPRLRQ